MPRPHIALAALLSSVVLAGCISTKSFIDPSVPKVSYEDLEKRAEPLRLKLLVQFQRMGQPFPKADSTLRDDAERVLRGTGLVVPVNDQAIGEISITVNNTGDLGTTVAKGIGSGLTLGLVGTTVMDAYEMSIAITINGKTVSRTAVKHAIYTSVGNTTLPAGVEVVPPNVAFGRVLEQMLLRALQDMQKSGELTFTRSLLPTPWRLVARG